MKEHEASGDWWNYETSRGAMEELHSLPMPGKEGIGFPHCGKELALKVRGILE